MNMMIALQLELAEAELIAEALWLLDAESRDEGGHGLAAALAEEVDSAVKARRDREKETKTE